MSMYSGKKAVIVGGTMGMGLAIAKRLVEGGAEVLVTGRNPRNLKDAQAELGPAAHVVPSDLSDMAAVRALPGLVEEKLGRVDHLFVNAGIAELAPIPLVTEEQYDKMLTVNLKGPYFTVQGLMPLLADGGSVVFTTSVADVTGTAGMSVYAATKAGLWSFAQALAAELAGRGIRVNAVSPGYIDTPGGGIQGLTAEEHEAFKKAGDEATPLHRHGTADEVARAALFLAVDATFTTGVKLAVDGGLVQQLVVA
ncbi:SDR family oxidoreductase [Streptomyces purpureus]|uniref:Oxidoreductase n=1 Tax=Streptomyces purpureus TaxID=1951 RepID=A0A918LMJ4_9ACTN|nr:SDR family oxidoreductase [Streptomyces purpureus]GGT20493.1 oxidoreductase [Streptomyces purpureus]